MSKTKTYASKYPLTYPKRTPMKGEEKVNWVKLSEIICIILRNEVKQKVNGGKSHENEMKNKEASKHA